MKINYSIILIILLSFNLVFSDAYVGHSASQISTGSFNSGNYTFPSNLVVDGNVGIGTTDPKATLDINGYVKLKKYTSAPVTCSSTYDGSIALTNTYKTCVCKGTSSTWVYTTDGSTTCVWT